jgi:hypothetical protein
MIHHSSLQTYRRLTSKHPDLIYRQCFSNQVSSCHSLPSAPLHRHLLASLATTSPSPPAVRIRAVTRVLGTVMPSSWTMGRRCRLAILQARAETLKNFPSISPTKRTEISLATTTRTCPTTPTSTTRATYALTSMIRASAALLLRNATTLQVDLVVALSR